MIFNITLFVQMLHFGIAYVLLKYLLFIPILRFIREQKELFAKMESAIIGLEDTVVMLKKQQQKEFESLKAHFLSHFPKVISRPQGIVELPPQGKLPQQTKEDVETLYQFRETLKNLLSQKLQG